MNTFLEKLNKNVRERNEAFQQMTREQRKVAVAKDCLEFLEAGFIKPPEGASTYVAMDSNTFSKLRNLPDGSELQRFLLSGEVIECECCARGALLISKVAKYNNCALDKEAMIFDSRSMHREATEIGLEDTFTVKELKIIECAYELNAGHGDYTAEAYAAAEMYCGYDRDQRLVEICQNIIDNNGNFTVDSFLLEECTEWLSENED